MIFVARQKLKSRSKKSKDFSLQSDALQKESRSHAAQCCKLILNLQISISSNGQLSGKSQRKQSNNYDYDPHELF